MNRSLRLSISSVLAALVVALAGAFGATPAFAASLTSIISTQEDELYSAYATKTSPDGNIQAIPAYDTDRVVFVYADTLTYVTVEDQYGDIAAPRAVAFAPDGNTLYVANYDSTSIAIIDDLPKEIAYIQQISKKIFKEVCTFTYMKVLQPKIQILSMDFHEGLRKFCAFQVRR